jgi:FkbM family methyltransferase
VSEIITKFLTKTILHPKVIQPIGTILTETSFEPTARVFYQRLNPKDKSNTQALQLFEIIKRSLTPHSNCIDIGCYKGGILRLMVRYAPNGTHFAFEPIPEKYHGLTKKFGKHAGVKLFNIALSDSVGESSFQHVINNPGYSGLKQRGYPSDNEQIEEIMVKTECLDNIVPRDIAIHLMKIDVEGAELQVFLGGIETIKRNRPIILFEHGSGAATYYDTSPEDVFEVLVLRCDLKISLMENWLEYSQTSPLNKDSFVRKFEEGHVTNFVAHP